jgi:uncharacterized protein
MKKNLILILFVLSTCFAFAQMDDKFYFPSKKWDPIMDSIKYKEINFFIEKDTLNTILIPSASKKVKATVIYFHGAGGNVSRYVKFVMPLVNDGYQVYMVDFRGYGKSSGKPTHLGIASDAQIILNSALVMKEIAGTKIIVYGSSMGTQIAAKIAAENQDKLSGLILDGTISSFTDIAAASAPEAQREMIKLYLPSPYSAKESIKALKTLPVLFIHSKEDKDVPFSQGETVFQNAITRKDMWIYVGDHLMAPKLYPKELVEKADGLLKLIGK